MTHKNLVTFTPGVDFGKPGYYLDVVVAAVLLRFFGKMGLADVKKVFCKLRFFLLHLSQLHFGCGESEYSSVLQVVTRFLEPP